MLSATLSSRVLLHLDFYFSIFQRRFSLYLLERFGKLAGVRIANFSGNHRNRFIRLCQKRSCQVHTIIPHISPDGGRGAYGWCSINEIWNASGAKYREINLCAEYLDRPIFELAATLLHEMAHLYNLVHGIQYVSNNGYYHNLKFKATAEAHGLHIEKHDKYGWTITTLAPEAEAWIRETLGEDKINASRLPVEGTTKGGSKKSINRSIKYVCPCCGTIIRATREVNVICGDCGEPFERE